MKKTLQLLAATSLLVFAACTSKKSDSPIQNTADSTAVVQDATQTADSTLYGTATDDWGMSTFALKTADGREVEVVRTRNDGTPAEIFGDLEPGSEYAITTTNNGASLGTAINLTQLKSIVGDDFKIVNGQLYLHPSQQAEAVEIVKLDADSLVAKGTTEVYRLGKQKH